MRGDGGQPGAAPAYDVSFTADPCDPPVPVEQRVAPVLVAVVQQARRRADVLHFCGMRCGDARVAFLLLDCGAPVASFACAEAPGSCGQYEVLLARGYVQRCAPQVDFCSTAGAGPSVSTHTSAAGNTLPSEENLSARHRRALLPQPSAALCSPLSQVCEDSRGYRCKLAARRRVKYSIRRYQRRHTHCRRAPHRGSAAHARTPSSQSRFEAFTPSHTPSP